MKHTLVGYTGFVGGNLAASHEFDNLYNSKNIADSFGADNGLVVYSGVPAAKYLANADPAADLAVVEQAMRNIERMKPEELVLISTVDVYLRAAGVYEDTPAGGEGAGAYGHNRHLLEGWVREAYPSALILRLPGLYGRGLKKNFIFDMLTVTPSMLKAEKYEELAARSELVAGAYEEGDRGFYRLRPMEKEERAKLRRFFEGNDFNALSFTDSRAIFQFYDLSKLWNDIRRCRKAGLQLVNLATEPVEAGILYTLLFGSEFFNELPGDVPRYDMRTRYGRELGGLDDYVADRAEVVAGIASFAAAFTKEQG